MYSATRAPSGSDMHLPDAMMTGVPPGVPPDMPDMPTQLLAQRCGVVDTTCAPAATSKHNGTDVAGAWTIFVEDTGCDTVRTTPYHNKPTIFLLQEN
jgi:hypothetical protein